jgi:hypothetical protein
LSGLAWVPEWVSQKVILCGAAALGLLVLSLLLRGVQKIITLLIAAALLAGGGWFIQDAWPRYRGVLPAELSEELENLANRALQSPQAKAAWAGIQREWSQLKDEPRAKLATGGEGARKAVAARLDAKIAELRREGNKPAADELARLRDKVQP